MPCTITAWCRTFRVLGIVVLIAHGSIERIQERGQYPGNLSFYLPATGKRGAARIASNRPAFNVSPNVGSPESVMCQEMLIKSGTRANIWPKYQSLASEVNPSSSIVAELTDESRVFSMKSLILLKLAHQCRIQTGQGSGHWVVQWCSRQTGRLTEQTWQENVWLWKFWRSGLLLATLLEIMIDFQRSDMS